jgi:hypothetical protein
LAKKKIDAILTATAVVFYIKNPEQSSGEKFVEIKKGRKRP